MMGKDRRCRRPADFANRSFDEALNRRAPWIGRRVFRNAVCACAAYAVADYLVSSSSKPWLLLTFELPEADDLGGEVNLETPGGMPEIVARRCRRSIRQLFRKCKFDLAVGARRSAAGRQAPSAFSFIVRCATISVIPSLMNIHA
jgi:hypothetical protein